MYQEQATYNPVLRKRGTLREEDIDVGFGFCVYFVHKAICGR